MFAREQEERKNVRRSFDLTVQVKGLEADLDNEKKEAAAFKEASTTQMGVLEDQVSNLQQKMQDDQKQHEVILQQNNEDHKENLARPTPN